MDQRPPVMRKFSRPAPAAIAPVLAVDDELQEWKKARGSRFPIKLLALTASLCFGIASFVLPADINDWVQYPLYALSGLSLYAGFRRKAQSR